MGPWAGPGLGILLCSACLAASASLGYQIPVSVIYPDSLSRTLTSLTSPGSQAFHPKGKEVLLFSFFKGRN